MDEAILLVDDEPAVLTGYQRSLGRRFQLETVASGAAGLERIDSGHVYAVVVSDMRMPQMNGIEFLEKVRARVPNTVRIMLTGNADMDTAIRAVNHGNVFRFLTKPCSQDLLAQSLNAALEQRRLLLAEKELLQDTLTGAVRVLSEVLSLVNPAAFGRAVRVQRYIRQISGILNLPNLWELEIAGLMSQLGCVTLHPDTIDAVYAGKELTADEESRFRMHPEVAHDLLVKIPRLERTAWMIEQQHDGAQGAAKQDEETRFGGEILGVLLAFDKYLSSGARRGEALARINTEFPSLDPTLRQSLETLGVEMESATIRSCHIDQLAKGMVAEQEVRSQSGMLIVAKGQEVSRMMILKLQNLLQKGLVPATMVVAVPKTAVEQLQAK
jgi:CheY-like chemotaxis protein